MEPNDFLSGLTQNKNPESDSIRLAVLIDLWAQGQWSEILSIPPGEYDGLAVLTTALRILDEESERGNTLVKSIRLIDVEDAELSWTSIAERDSRLAMGVSS